MFLTNCELMLKWIVLKELIIYIEMVLMLNNLQNLQRLKYHKTKPNKTK